MKGLLVKDHNYFFIICLAHEEGAVEEVLIVNKVGEDSQTRRVLIPQVKQAREWQVQPRDLYPASPSKMALIRKKQHDNNKSFDMMTAVPPLPQMNGSAS